MNTVKLIIALLFSVLTFGQDVAKKEKWTLEDCIQYAKEKNITIQSAALDQNSAEVNYSQSKSSRWPNLTGSASQSLSNGNTIDPITSDYVAQQIHSTSLGLNTSVTLFQGNQVNNQIKQNKFQVDQNSMYVKEAENNVVLSIVEAYMQALYSNDGVTIALKNLESSQKQMEVAKARFEAGSVAKKDYTDAVSQVATNKYSLIAAQNTYDLQLLTLKQLLELEPEDAFEIETTVNNLVVNELPDKIEVYTNALAQMPEIQASKLGIAISEKDLDIAKGTFLPTLTLSGSLGSGYTSTQNLGFADQLDLNFNQRVGLSLSIPIFNRNQSKSQVQNAKISIEKSKIEYRTVQKELYKKIETAWQNAKASLEQTEQAIAAKEAAQESYTLAQKKYELNALSTSDLVVAQNTLTNAEQNYFQAKYLSILYTQLLQFYQSNEIKL
ncbi:TolC family protein [Flavobacterium sp. NRK F10]|uniref:TolC family protein n=1 Tax=Flavobacterium sp. NRK F10 TaxID=2954931 RepID=UPI002091C7D0|nr:TolC family protein [Flavobacterium sp. NRK F10]MCO6174580.1 TolC family protein [Flavobacterium sp. NRK F10]